MARRRPRIGFCGIADFRHLHGREVIGSIQRACEILDLDLVNFSGAIKYSVNSDALFWPQYRKSFRFLNRTNIDGLITWASSLQEFVSDEEIIALHDSITNMPMVAIGAPLLPNVTGVYNDTRDGIRIMMDHLTKHHRFTRIAFVGPKTRSHHRERYNGYLDALRESQLAFDPSLVVLMNGDQRPATNRALVTLLDERGLVPGRDIQAILCISDNEAKYIIEGLQARGFDVPEDIAVCGFNNHLPGIQSSVPITTVDLDTQGKYLRAVQVLVDMIDSKTLSTPALSWPSFLVVRQSCGCFEETIEAMEPRPDIATTQAPSPSVVLQKLVCDAKGETSNQFLRLVRTVCNGFGDQIGTLGQNWIQGIRKEVEEGQFALTVLRNMNALLHQAQAMVTVLVMYRMQFKRADEYLFMSLGQIAVDFASATTGPQVQDCIRLHMPKLEVPAVDVVLFDEPGFDISAGHLALSYRETGHSTQELIPERFWHIPKGSLVGLDGVVRDQRQSLMFEMLHYNGRYFGYALFEMGPQHIPLYDTLRLLIGYSLHGVFGRVAPAGRRISLLGGGRAIRNLLSTDSPDVNAPSPLADRLVEYLADHLHEQTNLARIAEALNTSRTTLIRTAREQIGQSIQQMHEGMKIERAKVLLESQHLKVAEVAERLGYLNPLYFSQVFRKNTGLTPREWATRPQ